MRAVGLLLLVALHASSTRAAEGDARAVAPTRSPELLEAPVAEYPPELEEEGVQGEVGLRVRIDERGRVVRVDVVRPVHPALDWAALGAATQMEFSPAEVDGTPAAAVIDFRIDFARPAAPDAADAPPVAVADPVEPRARPGALRARVRVAGSALPLKSAELAFVPLGADGEPREDDVTMAFTDEDGRTRVTLPPGDYRVEVAAFGYEPVVSRARVASGATVDLAIAVRTDVGDPFSTVVRGRRSGAAVSRVTLTRDEVKAIPGTFGDPIRVVESLPGAARTPLFGGGLVLRGGMPGDSRIFLDGVEIPVIFHWGGLASIINASFLEELTFYPGGFPVEYGRATAGVVDIKTHALDMDAFVGTVDIDAGDIGFFLGGPVKLGQLPTVHFGVAARRSYLEGMGTVFLQLMALLDVPLPFLPVPRYWDFQTKVQTSPLPGHRVALTVFGADDRFGILGEDLEIGEFGGETLTLEQVLNNVVANEVFRAILEHEVRLAPGVRHVLRPWVGTTRRGALADNVVVNLFSGEALSTPERQLNWGVRDELSLRMTDELLAIVGMEHVGKTFSFGLGPPLVDPDSECPEDLPAEVNCIEAYQLEGVQTSTAVYARAEIGPFAGFTLHPGLRVESFGLSYDDRFDNVVDERKVLAPLLAVDPRVAARWELLRSFALKGSLGLYQRQPNLTPTLLDNDGTPLVPLRAWQAIVGFEHLLTPDLEMDVQLYGIGRDRLVENVARAWDPDTGRASFFTNALTGPSSYTNDGTGGTVGLEILLRHQPNRWFFGWVSYTFSRTWMDVGEERDPYHPAPFDQTHNVILVGRVNLPWELTLGGRFQYTTGNPSPVPGTIAVVHDLGSQYPYYQPLEDPGRRPRIPDFHRFDLRLDKKITFDDWALGAYVEIMNVYNRLNPEVIAPGGDFRSRGTVTILPSVPFLPTVGLSGSF